MKLKKVFGYVAALLACVVLAVGLVACNDKPKYALNETSVTLEVGGTHQIEVTGGENLAPEYASDHGEIASVSENGLVTAIAEGDAGVTVTVDGTKLKLNVKVNAKQGGVPIMSMRSPQGVSSSSKGERASFPSSSIPKRRSVPNSPRETVPSLR